MGRGVRMLFHGLFFLEKMHILSKLMKSSVAHVYGMSLMDQVIWTD